MKCKHICPLLGLLCVTALLASCMGTPTDTSEPTTSTEGATFASTTAGNYTTTDHTTTSVTAESIHPSVSSSITTASPTTKPAAGSATNTSKATTSKTTVTTTVSYDCNVADFPGEPSAAIQSAINACPEGGTVYIPAGTYALNNTILLKSHITLKGDSEKTILTFGDKLGNSQSLMQNANMPGEADVFVDNHITVQDIAFWGTSDVERTGHLLGLAKATDLTITDCSFRNNCGIALALGGCKNVTVRNCTFENNGLPRPSTVSRPALWTDVSRKNAPVNINVEDCLFRNNQWSGCYFMPQGGRIARCTFIDNGESSVFTSSNGSDIEYIDNYITGATMSNISACGLEIGASDVLVEGNLIENCGQHGISLMNTQRVVIRNNMSLNNASNGIFLYSLKGGGFSETEPDMREILIDKNILGNVPGIDQTQISSIGIWKNAGGAAINFFSIKNNTIEKNDHGLIQYVSCTAGSTIGANSDFTNNNVEADVTDQMRTDFLKALKKRMSDNRVY